MSLGREIVRLERVWNRLLAIDPDDKKKLLSASRKVDRLVAEYYRKAGILAETVEKRRDVWYYDTK